MSNKYFYLILFAVLYGCSPTSMDPIKQLNDVVRILNQNSSFEYTAYYNIQLDGNILKDTTSVVIYKSPEDLRLPLNYIFESKLGEIQLFDGQHFKTIISSERTIINTENPPEYLIVSNQGLLFSPYYIQSYLNYILENNKEAIKHIGDTLLNNKKVRMYEINTDYIYLLNGKIIRNGDLLPNQIQAENIKKKHLLIVEAESNYPVSIKEIYDDANFIEVSFSSIRKSDLTFGQKAQTFEKEKYLSLSMEDYMQIQISKQQEKIGKQAEDFILPLFPEAKFTLSELKGSPVLLEFWFTGCAFCLNAVPSINSIFNEYKSKGLEVIGVEFSNASLESIAKYIEKNKVIFPVAYKGKNQSILYGINSGPSFILLDKNHTIVYSESGLNEQSLRAEIMKVL